MTLYGRRFHGCRFAEYGWRGHRLIVMENELLKAAVVASKGADIVELRYKPGDLDVLWHAPQPLLPPGELIPTSPRHEGPFLDHYPGGWQEVFPNAGPATVYKGAELGQHGEVALQPWDVRPLEDDERRIVLEFSVETIRTPFRLERRMILEAGAPVLRLEETVRNLGEEPLHYAWGHHPAFGSPFLEEGCAIEMPECDVTQPVRSRDLRRRFATGCTGRFPELLLAGGSPGRVDAIPARDAHSEDVLLFSGFEHGRCALRNPRLGVTASLAWDAATFPWMWCWQVFGGSFGYPYYGRAYALALEPFNTPIENLAESAAEGNAPRLAAGASARTEFEARVEAT